jgi:hypothetical protein
VASRVLPFTVTIPAGTLSSAPFTQALALDNWEIESLDLEVPPGPAGLMGFQVLNNGVAWLPYGPNQWIVWDDTKETWDLTDQPNASGWAVTGYNGGVFNHSVILRFHVDPPSSQQTVAATPTVVIATTPDPTAVGVVL